MIKLTLHQTGTCNVVYVDPYYIVSLRQFKAYCEVTTTVKVYFTTNTAQEIMEAISSKQS